MIQCTDRRKTPFSNTEYTIPSGDVKSVLNRSIYEERV